MHKKLAADLTSLAHSILQMKNKEDVFALREKAHAIYEKLSVLAYVEEYINHTVNPTKTKAELLEEIEAIEEIQVESAESEPSKEIHLEVQVTQVEQTDQDQEPELDVVQDEGPDLFDEVEAVLTEATAEVSEAIDEAVEHILEEESEVTTPEELEEEPAAETSEITISFEEELKDTIAVDVAADLFESVPKKSLNDALQGDIQIGLNDRIAFVKNLFDGSQEDFNRVVSQLNSFKSMKEAKRFLNKMVKPDYDWSDKEEFEERFMVIVERKFA